MKRKTKINFTAIGGGKEIGANCYYLNINGTGIILDVGLHPQLKGTEALPDLNMLNDLYADVVLISHAHTDHIGALPYLIQKFPYMKIFTTPQTRDLAEVMLHNSLSIVQHEILDSDPLPAYTHEQVDLLTESFRTIAYNSPIQFRGYRHIGDSDIEISFLDAGHILGSAGILIDIDDTRIFYTGDTCASKQTILPGAEYPATTADVLILESTSCAVDSSAKRSDEIKKFAKSLNNIFERGGSVLIPIFALGKFQEILTILHNLMKKRSIPAIDIYTGGMGLEISDIYDLHRYNTRRVDKNFTIKDIPQLPIYNEDLLLGKYFRNPSIVLASSGMMIEGTTSFMLAQRWLKQKNFGIFFVGYVDPQTPANQVLNSKKGDVIKLTKTIEKIKVTCDINYFRLSSHSNREELLSLVEKLKPKSVILVHGESEGIMWIEKEINERFPKINVLIPELGKEYNIET